MSDSRQSIWVILPLKDFVNAKQRLSGVLAAHERRRLFHCMVEDVLDVLADHPGIEQTVIVSDDPSAELLANRYRMLFWSESALNAVGLNAVVNCAAAKLQDRGVDTAMVVHGDLPLMSGSDLQQLIDSHQGERSGALVSIAPDTKQTGSNCLLCSPPRAITFQYGEDSFYRHQQQARQAGVAFNVVRLPGIARDIDNPMDLAALLNTTQHKRSTCYLHSSGIAQRLSSMAIGDPQAPVTVRELP